MAKKLSTPVKLMILIVLTILFYTLWIYGLEKAYTKFLLGGTNTALSIIKTDTHIELEKENETYQFRVRTKIDGRKASFPQKIGSLLQPTVIILAWQLFLFFVLGKRDALRSLGINLGIFYLAQILLLVFLSGFYVSEVQKFIYLMLMDSFYVIAIVLVIKDSILYPVFRKA
ncbi:MAG: hypothetical protein IH598_16825 [Bacteroidales bacterium]|nr:hypothetical protein [Bacteroidales bacterium]